MKLNNKGWGTMQMFLLSGGLLIALLVAVFFIANLYGSFSGAVGNKQYIDLESKLESAAKNYVDSKNLVITGDLTINYNTLKNKSFIDELKDSNGKECNGYVQITYDGNNEHYKGYISCENYKTTNY